MLINDLVVKEDFLFLPIYKIQFFANKVIVLQHYSIADKLLINKEIPCSQESTEVKMKLRVSTTKLCCFSHATIDSSTLTLINYI